MSDLTLNSLLSYLFDGVASAIADFTAIYFVIGVVFLATGLFLLFIYFHARITGMRLQATVLGGVKRTKIKKRERNGETVREVKESIYIVYEYEKPDGTLCTEMASETGSGVLKKYRKGQVVELLVCPRGSYDDVYDANSKSALIIGLMVCAISVPFMSVILFSGRNLAFWILAISILLTGGMKLKKFLQGAKKPKQGERPKNKQFEREEIRPLEELTLQRPASLETAD